MLNAKCVPASSCRLWGEHPIVIRIGDALIRIHGHGFTFSSGLAEFCQLYRSACRHRRNYKERTVVMHIMTWTVVLLSLGWLCYTLIIKSKMRMQQNYIKQLEADVAELRKIATAAPTLQPEK
jgi:hypothetical protein